ncbi:hypothetical protein HK104_008101 [Borealophlyctis nickersoniae]|nr:hypothetical protein HK104_008101 [Borealophlyctis nickersoniae]
MTLILTTIQMQLQQAFSFPHSFIGKVYRAFLRSVNHSFRINESAFKCCYVSLCRFIKLGILPVFVFDSESRRAAGKARRGVGQWEEARDVRYMVELFGFPCMAAVVEAEADCAALNAKGYVDAVLSDDSDAFLFGATCIIRNWGHTSGVSASKREREQQGEEDEDGGDGAEAVPKKEAPEYVDVYRMTDVEEKLGWDRNALILIAVLSGSDFHKGFNNMGPNVASQLAKGGYGTTLIKAFHQNDTAALSSLLDTLSDECRNNTSRLLTKRHPQTSFTEWPLGVIETFTRPRTRTGKETRYIIQRFAKWYGPEMDPDVPGLKRFCEERIGWSKRMVNALYSALRMREVWKAAHAAVVGAVPHHPEHALLTDGANVGNRAVGVARAGQQVISNFFTSEKPTLHMDPQQDDHDAPASQSSTPSPTDPPLIDTICNHRNKYGLDEVLVQWTSHFSTFDFLNNFSRPATVSVGSSQQVAMSQSNSDPTSSKEWIEISLVRVVAPHILASWISKQEAVTASKKGRKRTGAGKQKDPQKGSSDGGQTTLTDFWRGGKVGRGGKTIGSEGLAYAEDVEDEDGEGGDEDEERKDLETGRTFKRRQKIQM